MARKAKKSSSNLRRKTKASSKRDLRKSRRAQSANARAAVEEKKPAAVPRKRAATPRKRATTSRASRSRTDKFATDVDVPRVLLVPQDPREIPSMLLGLNEEERRALRVRLGPDAARRLFRTARGPRGGEHAGRVVVLHGIMGSNLDSRDSDGSWDRVWVHYWRIAKGRLRDLELDGNGRPIPKAPEVRVQGLYEDYLPLIAELQKTWDVLPFAYDWRADIDESADRLADAISEFAHGEPVHIVAHSMGGLVARRFAQRHPILWKAIDDPSGRRKGGRLIQLGTPNRGSFAISLFLTGEEKIVKQLALLDLWHDKHKVVSFLRGFPGSYQMLPPPDNQFGDDRGKLHDAKQWGDWPVFQNLVDRGRAFQATMSAVVDPERLVYVAGYDQETPYRVTVKAPGVFAYRTTRNGDGRVPHDLGLLPDVPTFYVRAAHGDLPKDDHVLNGIHELLVKGATDALEDTYAPRADARGVAAEWRAASSIADVGPEFDKLRAARGRGRDARALEQLSKAEKEALQAALCRGALGASDPKPAIAATPTGGAPAIVPVLKVSIVEADITRIEADLYAVGHYQNVLPQNAERALDAVVSKAKARENEMVLRRDSRCGLLTGELGSVSLYPWRESPKKLVAVVGMGAPGTFGSSALRRLGQSLAFRALHLPNVEKVATVLIGSGEGNLTTRDAVRGLLSGAADALGQYVGDMHVRELIFVEWDNEKAFEIGAELDALASDEAFASRLKLDVRNQVRRKKTRPAATTDDGSTATKDHSSPPTRVSWMRAGADLHVSALTSTAVVPERTVSVDLALIDELVERMKDPAPPQARHDGAFLGRLVVPRDFRSTIGDAEELIVEVDRYAAGIHWEMLPIAAQSEQEPDPVAVSMPIARQLRTAYSPAPSIELTAHRPLRVLIVGDPGDPKEGWDLPGARREALAVRRVMLDLADRTGLSIDVHARIGAPSVARRGGLVDIPAASRLDVLDLLMHEPWDILHYCGHGDFDPKNPDRVGWVFASGLLTSHELQQMDMAPRLVVANACLSARTSDRLRGGKRSSDDLSEADLLPSLADEFFHRGVRNYVGTAWEVDDEGAILFATTFYEELLRGPTSGEGPRAIGSALLEARRKLFSATDAYGSLWAAYQHYGDPQEMIRVQESASSKRAPKRRRRSR